MRPFIYEPPSGPVPVLYECADFLIVDKPSGLLSVPGKAAGHADCLESRLQARYIGARIIHRLDAHTSGIMVIALKKKAHRHIGLQFERRHIAKTYIADIWGQPEDESGDINLPLICDWPNRPMQMVDHETGKAAQTMWEITERRADHTRVLLTPKTGRSHQLRVHMRELGHPILGDNLYAHDEAFAAAPRLCLHASTLELYAPTGGERLSFTAECPF
jgi:tRNA pseudouridine32 synthase/23S rRNA pseudouridine746 synthase